MRNITPNDFLVLLGKEEIIRDYQVTGDAHITSDTAILGKNLIFENCTFQGELWFKNFSIYRFIRLHNCEFKTAVVFENIKVLGYDSKNMTGNGGVIIRRSNFNNKLYFQANNNIKRGLEVNECEVKELLIEAISSKEGGIDIESSKFYDLLSINQCRVVKSIRLAKSETYCQVRWQNNICRNFSFLDNSFERDIRIWGGKTIEGLIFNDGVFKDNVTLESIQTDDNGSLTLIGVQFDKALVFEYEDNNNLIAGPKVFWLVSSEFNGGMFINGSKTDSYFPIKEITLKCSSKLRGLINFTRLNSKKINLEGINSTARVIFNDNVISELITKQFSNYSPIKLIDTKVDNESSISTLSIKNTYLGPTELANIDLSQFKKIEIVNSDIKDLLATNVNWFTYEKLNQLGVVNEISKWHKIKLLFTKSKGFQEHLTSLKNHREVFRQLKHAMLNQGNRIQSLVFKQYEMRAFTSELALTKSIFNRDRLILEFSRTNSHGQNWIRPILILLVITLLTYFLMTPIGSSNIRFSISLNLDDFIATLKEFYDYSYLIPKLLNPTHSVSDLFGEENKSSFWLNTIDILYKVIYAFLVFQIISAFRKYIK